MEDNAALLLPTNIQVMIIIHIGLLYFSRKPNDIDTDCLNVSGGYMTGPIYVSFPILLLVKADRNTCRNTDSSHFRLPTHVLRYWVVPSLYFVSNQFEFLLSC